MSKEEKMHDAFKKIHMWDERCSALGIKMTGWKRDELLHIIQGQSPLELHFWIFWGSIRMLGTDE